MADTDPWWRECRRRPRPAAWALWKMARPSQLLLVAVVYTLGAAMAIARGASPAARPALIGLAALLPTAASIHYANEYADVGTDRLTTRTPFSGGSGALPRTGLPRELALVAGALTLAVGVGIALAGLRRGLPPAAVALLGLGAVLGWQYSVGPLALVRRGLGELANAVAGGVLLPVYGVAVAAGSVDPGAVLATVPFAAVVFVNLLDTTWPDRAADAAVGKATLATRWSPRRLRAAYLAGLVGWAGSLALLAGTVLPRPVWLAGLVPAPLLVIGATRYTRTESPLPTVAAMVALAVAQAAAWAWLALA